MPLDPPSISQEIVERLTKDLKAEDSSQNELLADFIRQYYRHVAPEDLTERDVLDLRGAAIAHWQVGRKRKAGDTRIHIYNPHFEKHGWQSTHTIVEIVTDDRPFLVDSVSIALNRSGLTIHLIVHPVIAVKRDSKGVLKSIEKDGGDALRESFMHFEVDKITDPEVLGALETEIQRVIGDVQKAGEDWHAMRQRMLDLSAAMRKTPPPVPAKELEETLEFCRWVADNHFTFLGYCEHVLDGSGTEQLDLKPGTELGILSNLVSRGDRQYTVLPQLDSDASGSSALMVITKSNNRSTVHRNVYMDYIGIKEFGAEGGVISEHCFLGLFTSVAYSRSPHDIPLLRGKLDRAIDRLGVSPQSHRGKAMMNLLETFPRDDLFQISDNDLAEITLGIMELQERQRIRLFVRRDAYRRFFSCLVYIPRERYSRELRLRIQAVLMDAFNGHSVFFNTFFTESVLARIQFVIHCPPDTEPKYPADEIERRLIDAARSWNDQLREALIDQWGEERGVSYYHAYADAFPSSYREDYSARIATYDIGHIEAARRERHLTMNFYRPFTDTVGDFRFKLYAPEISVSLSEVLPVLENMGLKVMGEKPYRLKLKDKDKVWIHEFEMRDREGRDIDPEDVGELFQDAFASIWRGDAENDGFNRLVLAARLTWREIAVLRAYCKYLLQIRIPFSQAYMERTLVANPQVARLLFELFQARFEPDHGKRAEARQERLVGAIESELDKVAILDEDRILRAYLNLIQATLRTNYYQTDEQSKHRGYISFKLDPGNVDRMPLPKPRFEIWVYSPRVEGVHLRGGPVARGGLRWSDRREDFRTEILGLVKAQMVKNAVIVPTGSKGGFYVKQPPEGDREQVQAEAIECYKTFIRGMLDITDNLDGGELIPPQDVVRYDGDDPYLVVAADKGTATFSDIANGVAEDYGFWLGDAFASGGATGYDHKKMGITARGGWESVKRHFRELGLDTQSEEFTVVGIGDMAGDVFGNGMLLSKHIRLVAAFNHQHIFLDPQPDAASSYAERERLFKLPRSSWSDYDSKLISKGGGIYSRAAKSVTVSAQVRERLKISAEKLTPAELIQAILKAPVDLLWNGGIGTYVKASSETDAEVRDRANDVLRVNGRDLRCRVVGEGGNLGLTQRGRIEYDLAGGHIATDAIDNSGGVDCSDHEVNIKILLNSVVSSGDMTRKQRDKLLAGMTDDVAGLVLANNYHQTQAISLSHSQGAELIDEQSRYIRDLERRGKLARRLEFLPDDEELGARLQSGQGLARPELAVLLSYSKITLYEALTESSMPDEPYLAHELVDYFPPRLAKGYTDAMHQHRLRREIIATQVTNGMVDRVGPSFRFRVAELTGATEAEIAQAYIATREIFDLASLWFSIEDLDNKVPAALQLEMLRDAGALLERGTLWLLRNRRMPLDVAATVEFFREGVAELAASVPKPLAAPQRLEQKHRSNRLADAGVPRDLATRVGSLVALSSALDIVEVSRAVDQAMPKVAEMYYLIGAELDFHWLRKRISQLTAHNHWHSLAQSGLRAEVHAQQRYLATEVLRYKATDSQRTKDLLSAWIEGNEPAYRRFHQVMADIESADQVDFAMLSVALSEIQSLRRATSSH